MKRTTITIPDELAEGIEQYRRSQDPAPDLATVVSAALREYLSPHCVRCHAWWPVRAAFWRS